MGTSGHAGISFYPYNDSTRADTANIKIWKDTSLTGDEEYLLLGADDIYNSEGWTTVNASLKESIGRSIANIMTNGSSYRIVRLNETTYNVALPSHTHSIYSTTAHNHDGTYLKLSNIKYGTTVLSFNSSGTATKSFSDFGISSRPTNFIFSLGSDPVGSNIRYGFDDSSSQMKFYMNTGGTSPTVRIMYIIIL